MPDILHAAAFASYSYGQLGYDYSRGAAMIQDLTTPAMLRYASPYEALKSTSFEHDK